MMKCFDLNAKSLTLLRGELTNKVVKKLKLESQAKINSTETNLGRDN